MKRVISLLLCIAMLPLVLCCCDSVTDEYTDEMFALDTFISFKMVGDEDVVNTTIEKCKSEIKRLEDLLSATKSSSDVYAINNANSDKVSVSEETAQLIIKACEISKTCNGAFDISVYPLVKLWGFDTKEYVVPEIESIAQTKALVDYTKVNVSADSFVSLCEGMSIDLGAIAKGYIGDKLWEIMKQSDISRGLVNLGGMVVTCDNSDNYDYTIGVEYPDTGEVFAKYSTEYPFSVTSGAYQRYFEQDGVRYHHIIDTQSGYPSQSDISSVTVIGNKGVDNDALSTAFFVMGIDKTLEYLNTHTDEDGSNYSVIILNADKSKVYVSQDILDSGFELSADFEEKIEICEIK